MMTAETLVTGAPGKSADFSGRSGCSDGSHAAGFPPEVIYFSGKVSGAVTGSGLAITAPGGGGTQGLFVPFEQDQATLGVLSGSDSFFISDQFGGCDFTVLKNPAGQWAGSHVYSNAACRAAITKTPPGWKHVYTWKSGPYARRFGFGSSIYVVCFVTKSNLKFVMLRIQGQPPSYAQRSVTEATLSASVAL